MEFTRQVAGGAVRQAALLLPGKGTGAAAADRAPAFLAESRLR